MSRAITFFCPAPSAPPPPAPPSLDAYTASLFGAYGIARLLSAYTGHAMTVRRSSDSTTANIDFLVGGGLDTTTLLAFVGAGDGFVAELFDQSGAGNHFAQATTTKQPKIVSAGTYLGYLMWDDTDDLLTGTTASGGSAAATAYIGGTLRSTAARQVLLDSFNGSIPAGTTAGSIRWDYEISFHGYRNILISDTGTNLVIGESTAASLSTNVHTIVCDFSQASNATRDLYYVNASAQTLSYSTSGTISTSTVLAASENWNLGSSNDGTLPSSLNLYVCAIYNANHNSTTVTGVETVLNHYV